MTITRSTRGSAVLEGVQGNLKAGDIARLQRLVVSDESEHALMENNRILRRLRPTFLDDRLRHPLSLFSSEIQHPRSLSLRNCLFDWDPTHLSNLVHLHIEASEPGHISTSPAKQQLSRMLRELPRLENLGIVNDLDNPGGEIAAVDRDPIELPYLTTRLKLESVAPQWSEFITCIVAPSFAHSHISFAGVPRAISSTLTHLLRNPTK
ncbi:hypothetical protein BV25DRAFT_1308386 [Artomyces pyxidatus]|uniref:Uncharacterized protein n=1 Tax=Artomyces pyxidatus TaxID=48021 RepID=A0ACB8SPN0_9AGAM|nr:hypothetical protein BV25DRAFT_1308386 [Artomyces pyxidatus]